MTQLSIVLTREQVVWALGEMDLDWGDEEDATALVDLLSERFSATEAYTWIAWSNRDLDGRSPLGLVIEGRAREVFALARRVVGES